MTEIDVMNSMHSVTESDKLCIIHPDEFFNVKHINPINQLSSLVFMITINTSEHVTLQSIDRNTKNDVIKQITSEPFIDHEYILQFIQEMISHANSPICWLIYENCFCSIIHYLSLIKFPTNSVELFFSTNCWDKIFTENFNEYNFNCRKIFISFFVDLLQIVNSLKEIKLDYLFKLENILITNSGKLKIFPYQGDLSSNTKHPEDVALELLKCPQNFDGIDSILQSINSENLKISENSRYLRNVFEVGLIGVSLLFRGWSPFNVSDIGNTQWNNLHISPSQVNNINQDLWILQTIYDPSIHEDFIIKGFIEMKSTADGEMRIILEFFDEIFQPQISRKLNIDKIKILKNINSDLELDRFLKFLHGHYLNLIKETRKKANYSYKSRKRRFDGNYSNTVNNSGKISLDSCENVINNEGVSNWLEDGPAFQKLSQSKKSGIKTKNSCDLELRGISNWIDDGATFQRLTQLKEPVSNSPMEHNGKIQSENADTLEGISNWIDDQNSIKRLTDFTKFESNSFENDVLDFCESQEQNSLKNEEVIDDDQNCTNSMNDEFISFSSSSENDESTLSKVFPRMSSFFNKLCTFSNLASVNDHNSISLPTDVIIFDENNPPGSMNLQCDITQNSNLNLPNYSVVRDIDLQGILPNAKSIKLSIKDLPKPIISSNLNGSYNIYYDFNGSQLGGLYLEEIPENFIDNNVAEIPQDSDKLNL